MINSVQSIILGTSFLTIKALIYVGCYWNDQGNTLHNSKNASSTIECFTACVGFRYAGTQKTPKQCLCGNQLPSNQNYTCDKCNLPCVDGLTEMCGASCRLAVYDINLLSSTLASITLASASITLARANRNLASIPCNVATRSHEQTTLGRNSYISELTTSSALLNTTNTEDFLSKSTSTDVQVKTTSDQPPDSSTIHKNCLCPCKSVNSRWDFLDKLNLTRHQLKVLLKAELKEIEDSIRIDHKKTTKYVRTRKSASDNRTSAKVMGVVGGSVIVISIITVICCDLTRIYTKQRKRN